MIINKELSKVSVIIPTYNRSKIMEETLLSVLSQTYKNIEIIIVDDGSTDDTSEMINKYLSGVKYIKQLNQGVEAARKRGIQESTGEYLNFLDDDDLMKIDKIEKQVHVLETKQDVGVVHCRYNYIDAEGNHLETTDRLPEGDVKKQLIWGCFPWSGGPLIRRDCFKYIGDDEHKDWHGDWGMWLRFALAGYKFGCVQEPLGSYRMIRGSMTDEKISNAERLIFNILDTIFSKGDLSEDITNEKNKIYAGWHFWVSCRYYIGGFWDDAKRNLIETITLNGELIENPTNLLDQFYMDAISPRVRIYDPIKFINDIFDHLPDKAEPIKYYRGDLLCRIYANLAMKSYGTGKINEAKKYLHGLINYNKVNDKPSDITYSELNNYKIEPSIQVPFHYLKKIFNKLELRSLQYSHNRPKIIHHLVEANITCAFQNYIEKNWKLLFKRMIVGMTNYPFIHIKTSLFLLIKKFSPISRNHTLI